MCESTGANKKSTLAVVFVRVSGHETDTAVQMHILYV